VTPTPLPSNASQPASLFSSGCSTPLQTGEHLKEVLQAAAAKEAAAAGGTAVAKPCELPPPAVCGAGGGATLHSSLHQHQHQQAQQQQHVSFDLHQHQEQQPAPTAAAGESGRGATLSSPWALPPTGVHHLLNLEQQHITYSAAASNSSSSIMGSSPDLYRAFRLGRYLTGENAYERGLAQLDSNGVPTAAAAGAGAAAGGWSHPARSDGGHPEPWAVTGDPLVERAGTAVSNSSFGCSMFDRTPSGMHLRAESNKSLTGCWDEVEGTSGGSEEGQQRPLGEDVDEFVAEQLSCSSPAPPMDPASSHALHHLQQAVAATSLDGTHHHHGSSSSGRQGQERTGQLTRSSSSSSWGGYGSSPPAAGSSYWRGPPMGGGGAGGAAGAPAGVDNESFGTSMGMELLKQSR
jgi:hypothetical protein